MDPDLENYYDDLEGPEEEHIRPQRPTYSPPGLKDKAASNPQLVYMPDSHTTDAFNRLIEMRDSKKLCDVIIHVGELTVNAHRVVLAACSPYFTAMFSGEMKESNRALSPSKGSIHRQSKVSLTFATLQRLQLISPTC